MFADQVGRIISTFWVGIVSAAVACGLVGAGLLGMRSTTYQASAATSVSTNSKAADPATVQALASTVLISMPAYVAQAQGPEVVASAARASGLPESAVSGALGASRDIDSTVINWTMTAPDPTQARTALEGAIKTFTQQVESGAALGKQDAPLTLVLVTQPPSDGQPKKTSPILGFVGGAVLGAILALAVCALLSRLRAPINDWDSVELACDVPVIAELSPRSPARSHQLAYLAEYLARRGAVDRVLAIGIQHPPTAADVDVLAELLRQRSEVASDITTGSLADDETPDRVASSDAVVVFVDRHRDDVTSFGPDLRTVRRLAPGTVALVLDSPGKPPSRRAAAVGQASPDA